MIQFKNLTYQYETQIVLQNLSATLPSHQKIAVVGKNGCGKTTLFKLISKKILPDNGELSYPKNWHIAYLDQSLPDSKELALTYVIEGDSTLKSIQENLRHAEKEKNYERVLQLHQKILEIDGYTAEMRASKIMLGLGFSEEDQIKEVNQFSGGWRMRLKIARLLLSRADLFLLDEPTNHLDFRSILWLETWLKTQKTMVLIVSHDRDFLDNITKYTLYIHQHQAKLYTGNYSTFEKQRALELQTQASSFEKQTAKIAQLQKFVDKFRYKATKAKQAQSRLKMIERLSVLQAVQEEMDINFEIPPSTHASGTLLSLNKAEFGYPNAYFRKVNFSLYKGQRVALLGENGAGKSTFMKALAGKLALVHGERICASHLKIAYFAQNTHEQLDLSQNAITHMQILTPNTPLNIIRSYLGSFGFSQEMALKTLQKCSGGEKMRLMLAMLIWQAPDLLLLDEPSNHLDLSMCNALSSALQAYQGGIVLISHDRALLNSVADELYLLEDGKITAFQGDLKDYQNAINQKTD